MARILIAVRDFLVVLALSWIGVAFDASEREKQKAPEDVKSVATLSFSGGDCG